MSERLRVHGRDALLPFVANRLPDWSRTKLKKRLHRGCITVNGKTIRRHDHPLQPGDEVAVLDVAVVDGAPRDGAPRDGAPRDGAHTQRPAPCRARPSRTLAGLPLLHLDDDLVAIDKPAGLLSVSTSREQHRTALAKVRQSLGKNARLWPVHRLDRETSGVLLFARSRQMREAVVARWKDAEKVYLAIVAGVVGVDEGVVDTPLWEDAEFFVHAGSHPRFPAREARTRFVVRQRRRERTLLEVRLDTGRKHQIRVHLCAIGHPVVGDPRYGQQDARLGLHALHLSVTHPGTSERLELHAEPPALFSRLLR